MNYFRGCPDHLYELQERRGPNGGEIVACPEGHECKRWFVMDPLGHVVGIGYIDKPGFLMPGFFDMIVLVRYDNDDDGPRQVCPQGHQSVVMGPEGRPRCLRCMHISRSKYKARQRKLVQDEARIR